MKIATVLVLVGMYAWSAEALAQAGAGCGGGAGMGGGGAGVGAGGAMPPNPPPGGGPNGKKNPKDDPKAALTAETVVLRCTAKPSATLLGALAQLPGVKDVVVDADASRIRLSYTGSLDGLRQLESVASRSGQTLCLLSHARVKLEIRSLGELLPFAQVKAKMEDVEGVRIARIDGRALAGERIKENGEKQVRSGPKDFSCEWIADLDRLSPEAIRELAKTLALDIKVVSHEAIVIPVKDGADALKKALLEVLGLLTVESGEDGLHCWIVKPVSDEAIQKAAEKVAAKIDPVRRS